MNHPCEIVINPEDIVYSGSENLPPCINCDQRIQLLFVILNSILGDNERRYICDVNDRKIAELGGSVYLCPRKKRRWVVLSDPPDKQDANIISDVNKNIVTTFPDAIHCSNTYCRHWYPDSALRLKTNGNIRYPRRWLF